MSTKMNIPLPSWAYVLTRIKSRTGVLIWGSEYEYALNDRLQTRFVNDGLPEDYSIGQQGSRIVLTTTNHALGRMICSSILRWPAMVLLKDTDQLTFDDLVEVRKKIATLVTHDYSKSIFVGAITQAFSFENLEDAQRVAQILNMPLMMTGD